MGSISTRCHWRAVGSILLLLDQHLQQVRPSMTGGTMPRGAGPLWALSDAVRSQSNRVAVELVLRTTWCSGCDISQLVPGASARLVLMSRAFPCPPISASSMRMGMLIQLARLCCGFINFNSFLSLMGPSWLSRWICVRLARDPVAADRVVTPVLRVSCLAIALDPASSSARVDAFR